MENLVKHKPPNTTGKHTLSLSRVQHFLSRCGWVGPQFLRGNQKYHWGLLFFMDPEQLSGFSTVQLLDLLTAIVGILQQRLGPGREPTAVESIGVRPEPNSAVEPQTCIEYFLTCDQWSIHCTPVDNSDPCHQPHLRR